MKIAKNSRKYWVCTKNSYRKVASSRLSQLVANFHIFRLFMKGNFEGYVLWPLDKMVQNWIVDRSTACDFTVFQINSKQKTPEIHANPHIKNLWQSMSLYLIESTLVLEKSPNLLKSRSLYQDFSLTQSCYMLNQLWC